MVYVDKASLEKVLSQVPKRSLKQKPNEKYRCGSLSSTPIELNQFDMTSSTMPAQHNEHASSEESKAFKKIERLVKVRDRSIHETKVRLEKEEFSEETILKAVKRAQQIGFLDDTRFADVLVRSRLRAGKGLAGIIAELQHHHIDPNKLLEDFPEGYLSQFPTQEESALALLYKKPPRAKNKMQAAYAKLIRNGYTSSVAAEVAREWYRLQE